MRLKIGISRLEMLLSLEDPNSKVDELSGFNVLYHLGFNGYNRQFADELSRAAVRHKNGTVRGAFPADDDDDGGL